MWGAPFWSPESAPGRSGAAPPDSGGVLPGRSGPPGCLATGSHPSALGGDGPGEPRIVAVIAAIFLSAFYQGYQMKILRGEVPLPAVSGYGKLFSDGIKYLIITFIYAIPVLIILAVTIGGAIMTAVSAGPNFEDILPIIGAVILGVIIALIVGFIIGLFAVIGLIRFARTGRMGDAFSFGAIKDTIGRIGWGHYILSLIVVGVIVVIVSIVFGVIPYIGWLLNLIIAPFIAVFYSRYLSLLYDSGQEGVVAAPETGA